MGLDDRRWLVVDAQGDFSRRGAGRLLGRAEPLEENAQIKSRIISCGRFAGPGSSAHSGDGLEGSLRGADLSDASADWMSRLLGQPCRVVWMPGDSARRVRSQAHSEASSASRRISILLTTEESLRAVSVD